MPYNTRSQKRILHHDDSIQVTKRQKRIALKKKKEKENLNNDSISSDHANDNFFVNEDLVDVPIVSDEVIGPDAHAVVSDDISGPGAHDSLDLPVVTDDSANVHIASDEVNGAE